MNPNGRIALTLAAAISLGVALLHVEIVALGPAGYRYFGAPALADAVERGSFVWPALLTFGVALVFAIWGLYALSGAGLMRRLPLLRTALLLVGLVLVLRGVLIVPELLALVQGTLKYKRGVVFSAVSLLTGVCFLVGAAQAWSSLHPPAWRAAGARGSWQGL